MGNKARRESEMTVLMQKTSGLRLPQTKMEKQGPRSPRRKENGGKQILGTEPVGTPEYMIIKHQRKFNNQLIKSRFQA